MKKTILPSLKVQFIVIVLSIISVFVFVNLMTGKLISNLLFEKNLQYSKTISQKLIRELEFTDERIEATSSAMQFNIDLQKYFIQDMNLDNIKKIEKDISVIKLFYKDIFDIALIDNNINSIYLQKDVVHKYLMRVKDKEKLKCLGFYNYNYLDKDITTLLFNSKIYGTDLNDTNGKILGNIIISINIDSILNNFDAKNVNGISFILFDKYNNYYPINCSNEEIKHIVNKVKNSMDKNIIIDEKNVIIKEIINDMDLCVVSNIDKRYIKRDVNYILLILAVICIIFIIIICFCFLYIYINTIKPIRSIGDYLKTIISGNYKKLKEKVIAHGNKEIVELADDLNNMIDEIDNLTHQLFETSNNLYQSELEKKKAEISYLRSQINPHFLYNTLETIKGIAMTNNIQEISIIAQCLGDIFRYSIKGSNEVLLKEEIKMIKAYINIQTFKFGNKNTVFYNIDSDTLNMQIPKMIMQPIVENAFIHAIEKNTSNTTLYIATKIEKKDLVIIIQDDGIGIESNKLNSIIDSLNLEDKDNSNHVGLSNVHKRTKMIYGDKYGVSIESAIEEGTKISILLPIIRKN
jgi:two-component system sensor histidine kinase YesM